MKIPPRLGRDIVSVATLCAWPTWADLLVGETLRHVIELFGSP